MTRGEALVLRAAAGWTVFIWVTRMRNTLGDDTRSTGFKAVHLALAAVSVAFAVGIWVVASRSRRRDQAGISS
ncbi:MAG: hypothetical protein ACRD0Q_07985 [Acidimicrobiales bacterium]